jgi:hypothetical protein
MSRPIPLDVQGEKLLAEHLIPDAELNHGPLLTIPIGKPRHPKYKL